MSKEKKVIDYYVLCNKLKDVIRTGWINWDVQRNRIESVAEHIYGVEMLAIAMKSEYQYDIDILKVIYMLAIHELGEIIIGDLTPLDKVTVDKQKIEHEAVHSILKDLIDGETIEQLFLEFDAHETKEALFAYQCDKLECDIQCKLYDQEGCVDLSDTSSIRALNNKTVNELLEKKDSWSDKWITYGQKMYPYDKNFLAVSNYIKNNDIGKEEENDN